MTVKCRLRFARHQYDTLYCHLFPGDQGEHGAVLLAGLSNADGQTTLLVREVHLAEEGTDYVEGTYGHRALSPKFIHRLITRARDERLVYLAVHNHGSDQEVSFSRIDTASHERGYPALLQIARGMPVGALVLGNRSIEADIWMPGGQRQTLDHAVVVGSSIERLMPRPERSIFGVSEKYERQVRLFGKSGQRWLSAARVAIIGLGGIGSLVAEYLARIGVGRFLLIDSDRVEESNLSRIVGAILSDANRQTMKVDVARRLIKASNKNAIVDAVVGDVASERNARRLLGCDYMFLAADSMRARLVFNAIVQQYFIPGVQLGSKIRSNSDGKILDIFSANRPVRPGRGCLWCSQLIDPNILAKEAKTDEERKAQAYGVDEPNPSVISLNAISAAHACNDFLLDYLRLRPERTLYFEHYHLLTGRQSLVEPRNDSACPECSEEGWRFGMGDGYALPTIEG